MLKRPTIILIKPIEVEVEQNQQQQQACESEETFKIIGCNCKKSQCLKLYCPCFHDGKECAETCSCEACSNTQTQYKERKAAIVKVIQKYKSQSLQKFQKQKTDGCSCIKSHCQMKYCECYIRGQSCGISCGCKKCKNGKNNQQTNLIPVIKASDEIAS